MSAKAFSNLAVIAHVDLPGNYRLIRIKSADLCDIIQPGDVLLLPQLQYPLPYFRHSLSESKVDFLVYLRDENRDILTHHLLPTARLQHTSIPPKKLNENAFRILSVNACDIGSGLSIALDSALKNDIDLFLFEIDNASPFKLQPSKFYLPYMLEGVIANMDMLEQANSIARFYSTNNLPGCFDGTMMEFVRLLTERLKDRAIEVIHFVTNPAKN